MKLTVNGADVEVDDRHAKSPLLWVLRDVLGMRGTKFGCGNSHTEFARESAIDELAVAAGRDPLELRRELLADNPRTLRAPSGPAGDPRHRRAAPAALPAAASSATARK